MSLNIFKKILNKLREAFKIPEYVYDPKVYILYKDDDNVFYDIKICKESVAKAKDYYILGTNEYDAEYNYTTLMLKASDLCENKNEE